MKKGILRNLAKIIGLTAGIIILSAIIFYLFWLFFDVTNDLIKANQGESRQAYIEVLDEKTKRIEDTGLTLQELTDEEVNSNLSKTEIDGYYVFKFNKEIYEVSIYFDNEENIVSIQKEYPEKNDFILPMLVIIFIVTVIVLCVVALMVTSIIRDIIVKIIETIKAMKQDMEE